MFKLLQKKTFQKQIRSLSIHEHSSMSLLKKYGVVVARGSVAQTPQEALQIATDLGPCVIKAQVLAGGRGKGHFTSGLQGGVQFPKLEEIKALTSKMIGYNLITKQTGKAGRPCNEVFVVEKVDVQKEFYFAIVMDRQTQGPVIIASSQGGMDIETVAHDTPELIVTHSIDIRKGLSYGDALTVAKKIGFQSEKAEKVWLLLRVLYKELINLVGSRHVHEAIQDFYRKGRHYDRNQSIG
jgi:succinyl-CoA synthetase beta subunit